MPLYDYRCRPCGAVHTDVLAAADEVWHCPDCGTQASRVIGSVHIGAGKPAQQRAAFGGWGQYREQLASGDVKATAEAHYDVMRHYGISADRAKDIVKDSAAAGVAKTEEHLRNIEGTPRTIAELKASQS